MSKDYLTVRVALGIAGTAAVSPRPASGKQSCTRSLDKARIARWGVAVGVRVICGDGEGMR